MKTKVIDVLKSKFINSNFKSLYTYSADNTQFDIQSDNAEVGLQNNHVTLPILSQYSNQSSTSTYIACDKNKPAQTLVTSKYTWCTKFKKVINILNSEVALLNGALH